MKYSSTWLLVLLLTPIVGWILLLYYLDRFGEVLVLFVCGCIAFDSLLFYNDPRPGDRPDVN